MPFPLIEEQCDVRAQRYGGGDFRQMLGHPLRVTARRRKRRTLALGRRDRPIDISRCRAPVLWR